MKKYSAVIKEEYRFTFESNSTSMKELEKEAEDFWEQLTSLGLESDNYEDMEVYRIEEIEEK